MKFLYKKTFFIFPFLTSIYLQAQEKPNLVFIMADQWRGDALGCLGKEPVKTPCLDQLAREGVNFTNAVSRLSRIFTGTRHVDDRHVSA